MKFKRHTFPQDNMHYISPSWDDLDKLALSISRQILKQNNEPEQQLDRIVTLAKGGWPMTRSLVDYLEINEVASVGVKFYSGIGTTFDKPRIYQEIPVSVKNEKVLLFDDVSDTGHSLAFVKDHLVQQGVGEITTATLFLKPRSKVIPDFFAAETEDWIIFPYDQVEAIRVLGQKWKERGISEDEIKNRLSAFDISDEVIQFYLSK